jgi:hypothetical protein
MNKRPTSVSVIAWILIVMGCISIIMTISMTNNPTAVELMKKNPLPIPLQYAINFLGLGIMIASGAAMLKGLNWGRLLYITWTLIAIIIGLFTSPMKAMLLPSLVFLVIVIFFLFRPKANEFFKALKVQDNA